MFFTKLILDIAIGVAVASTIPLLIRTMIDILKKGAGTANDGLRRLFKLDEEEN